MTTEKIGSVEVDFVGDNTGFLDANKDMLESLAHMTTSLQSVASIASSVYSAITGSVLELAKAYAVQRGAESAALRTFGEGARELFAQASELQGTTLFGDEVSIQAATMLGQFGLVKDEVKAMMPHLQDLAQHTKRDLPDAAKTLGDAIVSNSLEPLKEMGVGFDEATRKGFGLLTRSEQLKFIMAVLEDRFEGAAKGAANSAAGAMVQLDGAMGDLNETFGSYIDLPLKLTFQALTTAVQTFDSAIKGIPKGIRALGQALDTTGGTVGIIAGALLALAGTGKVLLGVLPAVKVAVIAFGGGLLATSKSAMMFAKSMAIAVAPVLAWAAGITLAFGLVVATVGAAEVAWETNFLGIQNITERVFKWLQSAFEVARTTVGGWAKSVTTMLTTAFKFWEDKVKWIANLPGVKDVLKWNIEASADVDEAIHKISKELAGGTEAAAIASFEGVKKVLTRGAETMGLGKIKDIIDSLVGYLKGSSEAEDGKTKVVKKGSKELDELTKRMKELSEAASKAKKSMSDFYRLAPVEQTYIKDPLRKVEPSEIEASKAKGDVPWADSLIADTQKGGAILADGYKSTAHKIGAAGIEVASALSNTAGQIIQAGMQGFTQGGPMGAIIAVIAEVLTSLKTIISAFEYVDVGLNSLFDAISPLFAFFEELSRWSNTFLLPLFETLGDLFASLGSVLSGVFRIIQSVLAPVFEKFNNVVGTIVDSIEPMNDLLVGLLSVLEPIIGAFAEMASLLSPLKPLLDELNKVIDWFSAGIESVLGVFSEALVQITETFEGYVKDMKRILGIKGTDPAALTAAMETSNQIQEQATALALALEKSREDIEDTTRDPLKDNTPALEDNTKGLRDMSSALKEATESLLNVPSTYKLVQARLAAIGDSLEVSGFQGVGTLGGTGGGGTTTTSVTVYIENVNAQNAEELVEGLESSAAWQNLLSGGTTEATIPSPGSA